VSDRESTLSSNLACLRSSKGTLKLFLYFCCNTRKFPPCASRDSALRVYTRISTRISTAKILIAVIEEGASDFRTSVASRDCPGVFIRGEIQCISGSCKALQSSFSPRKFVRGKCHGYVLKCKMTPNWIFAPALRGVKDQYSTQNMAILRGMTPILGSAQLIAGRVASWACENFLGNFTWRISETISRICFQRLHLFQSIDSFLDSHYVSPVDEASVSFSAGSGESCDCHLYSTIRCSNRSNCS
jgi:hypothetical protein